MKILVFGHNGQVATELRELHSDAIQTTTLARADADLTEPTACVAAIDAHAPDAVINAAGYTAVDHAESDADTAYLINAVSPAAMARACAARDIPFVSVSTDYVFSGAGDTPWAPADPTDPQGVYGRTKRDGELAIAVAGGRYAVLRTSWVVSAQGNNFVKTMLRLGLRRSALQLPKNLCQSLKSPASTIFPADLIPAGPISRAPFLVRPISLVLSQISRRPSTLPRRNAR